MNSAKVIGKTYSDFMHPSLEGKDIKILQVINAETGKVEGRPFFATDPLGVSIDEMVAFETSFQATWSYEDHMVPVDCSITAIIDSLDIEEGESDDNR